MSTLYVSTDLEQLAAQLCKRLDAGESGGHVFLPTTIIVPNRNIKKWLQLYLARHRDIAINLRIQYLENSLWDMLQALTTFSTPAPLEALEHERYRLLLLSVFLNSKLEGDLAPLKALLGVQDEFNGAAAVPSRKFYRSAWELADQLARLIREYEYHRQDELIQRWLSDACGIVKGTREERDLERCQRALFRLLAAESSGLRDRLSAASNRTFKTLPQYANEVMSRPLKAREDWPEHLRARPVHIFGIPLMSAYHVRVLHWLGTRLDLCIYHPNPLAARILSRPDSWGEDLLALRGAADKFRSAQSTAESIDLDEPDVKLLKDWGRAGAESLWRLGDLLDGPDPFTLDVLAVAPTSTRGRKPTVLARFQDDMLNRSGETKGRAQDTSLQIIACPGQVREVETVCQSIIGNMVRDASLKLTDIAILVPNMNSYRPVIQAVFDREACTIPYNLCEHNAASSSVFGQALLGMLDMALESFNRTRVFEVLLNPCVLAKLNVEREQALVWLDWAERLGIYHGWDMNDKQERGYSASPLYSWLLGLRRLRLGRLMEMPDARDDETGAFGNYKGVVPYTDLESGDLAQLDAFCRAVEGLLPRLRELRKMAASGAAWSNHLRRLADDFLEIPSGRKDEAQVRISLLSAFSTLATLDCPRSDTDNGAAAPIPLALVREYVEAKLNELEGASVQYLMGGVSVSAPQPLLGVPFRIIYVLGLGEGIYPISESPSALDLRELERKPGDVRAPEAQRAELLQALLSAHDAVYLLYPCKELQKDQDLHPSGCVNKLQRYIEKNILQPNAPRGEGAGKPKSPKKRSASKRDIDDEVSLFSSSASALEEENPRSGSAQIAAPAVSFANKSQGAAPVESKPEFQIIQVPLHGYDPRYLAKSPPEKYGRATDVFVNYSFSDRKLALLDGLRTGRVGEGLLREQALDEVKKYCLAPREALQRCSDAVETDDAGTPVRIKIGDLKDYLMDPAEKALKRHLGLRDEDEPELLDNEPFYTDRRHGRAIVLDILRQVAVRSETSLKEALVEWPQRFEQVYEQRRQRGLAPEGSYAEVDSERLEIMLRKRIHGEGKMEGLGAILERFAFEEAACCGPIQIGQSSTPLGARQRFPALRLSLPSHPSGTTGKDASGTACREVLLSGHTPFAWIGPNTLEIPVLTYKTSRTKVNPAQLTHYVFEPVLFYLALQAAEESCAWLNERPLKLHVVHDDGYTTYVYAGISSAQAREYLTALAADVLNPACFDRLPFLVFSGNKMLKKAYELNDGDNELVTLATDFKGRLEELLAEDGDQSFKPRFTSEAMDLVDARVPDDAFEKIRRRFKLLDSGPAVRRAVAETKKEKKISAKD